MSGTRNTSPMTDRMYEFLVEEDEVRVCKGIPDEACQYVPRNFFLLGATKVLTRLADELANAKTVLPWLLSILGASGIWVGMLVPVRESMSMLPQLAIASFVQRTRRRKFAWICGAAIQAFALAAMAASAFLFVGPVAGEAVVGLLLLFSLARGICSVASKDILGKTIPKTRRGRLNGFTVAIAGILTLAVGTLLATLVQEESSIHMFVVLLAAAATLWVLSSLLVSRIQETVSDTGGTEGALRETLQRLAILRNDPKFCLFVVVRALFVSTALAAPYYVVIARESGAARSLGVFVIASGLASALSSVFWGRFADKSSRQVLIMSGAFASILGVAFFLIVSSGRFSSQLGFLAPGAFFLLAIAHSGVRIGRKTYVVDLATEDNRLDYVSVSNTIIGVIVLASGLFGLLEPMVGAAGMLLIFSLLGGVGVLLGAWLPELE